MAIGTSGVDWNFHPLFTFGFIAIEREGKVIMAKAGILWLLGVPVIVIVLLALFTNVL